MGCASKRRLHENFHAAPSAQGRHKSFEILAMADAFDPRACDNPTSSRHTYRQWASSIADDAAASVAHEALEAAAAGLASILHTPPPSQRTPPPQAPALTSAKRKRTAESLEEDLTRNNRRRAQRARSRRDVFAEAEEDVDDSLDEEAAANQPAFSLASLVSAAEG